MRRKILARPHDSKGLFGSLVLGLSLGFDLGLGSGQDY